MLTSLLTYPSIFIFIFSILYGVRVLFVFISSVLSDPPKPLEMSTRELKFTGLSLSYIITFIIYLLS